MKKRNGVPVGWQWAACVVCILLIVIFPGIMEVQALEPSLIVQYDFDGSLTDALGNSTLTAFETENDGYSRNNATSGFGTDSDGTYWFWTSTLSRGGGFWIDIDENISDSYSVGVRFRYNQTGSGYRKIIDYRNSTSDTGFYFLGGRLNFYPLGTGTTTIAGGDLVDIIATRESDGTFTAYYVVNGEARKELQVGGSGDSSRPILVDEKPRLGFFFDDTATSSEATDGGRVYSIRIWNGPITEDDIGSAMNTVAYNGNGHETGQPPVDANSYASGAEVTVLGNTGNMEKEGHDFTGWNTAADKSGTAYAPGSTFEMGSAGVTFYALWEESTVVDPPDDPVYTVAYHGNGSTRGVVPEDEKEYLENDEVTVLGNTGSLRRSRYSFRGWNTVADGSGVFYRPGDTFIMGDADVNLYARWRRVSTDSDSDAVVFVPEPEPEHELEESVEPVEEPEAVPFSAHFYQNRTVYRVMSSEYEMDAEPMVREDRVMLPLRYAAYAVGIGLEQIVWDPDSRTVTVDTGKVTLRVVIGSSFMEINGEPIPLEVPAEIINGRTMLPIRAISEALGYEVLWLEETREVVIREAM